MAEKVKIEIPGGLYRKIDEKIKGTEFRSVSDYVAFVLMEILSAEDDSQGARKQDDAQVKDRLRSLGYLD